MLRVEWNANGDRLTAGQRSTADACVDAGRPLPYGLTVVAPHDEVHGADGAIYGYVTDKPSLIVSATETEELAKLRAWATAEADRAELEKLRALKAKADKAADAKAPQPHP